MPETDYSPDLNAHLWRSCRNLSGRLGCGVVLDGRGGIEEWALRVIELLRCEPVIGIKSIYLLAPPNPPARSSGAVLFEWLNRRGSLAASSLNRVEIRVPAEVPIVQLSGSDGEIRARIAESELDVLIWLESRPFSLECDGLARLGVWYFICGEPDEPRSDPPYWTEASTGRDVSTLALEQNMGRGNVRRPSVCHLATQQGWRMTANAVQPLALAGAVLLRGLLDVLDDVLDPEASPQSSPVKPASRRMLPPPGNFKTASWIIRQALRAAAIRWAARGRTAEWFVAVRNNLELFRTCQSQFVPHTFRDVPSPRRAQFADPLVVDDNGRHWLFVEEIPAGASKGRLTVMELDRDGAKEPVTILERPYHLSYPFVFRDGRDYFMIPETSANNTIELYRATRFPFEWNLEKILYSNVRAVDTTPLFLDGIWYFFTTSARLGYETFLFWSDRLDGEWHYHPRNPICSDVRRARGAGPLFRSNGELIRPAQDCSVRYGYAIALNRVLHISPSDYAEELIEVIFPKWRKDLLGTHTLSSSNAFEAIDGLRYPL
jgi:hypothetical protein